MIKKTLFSFILVFGMYTLVIILYPNVSTTNPLYWDNTMKTENYLYNNSDTLNHVILGTSLSCRLVMDSLPMFYNLAFTGRSIYDGLEIVIHREKLPKTIFIETNFALRKEAKDFTDDLLSPFNFYLKKYCISLRQDKQPLGFIKPIALYLLTNSSGKVANNTSSEPINKDVFNKILGMKVVDYSSIPSNDFVDHQFLILKKDIQFLQSKGVNIVFFEMPINSRLVGLPLTRTIKDKFSEYFPSNKFNYIKPPDHLNYETSDGDHLNIQEAIDYTIYFRNEAKRFF